MHSEETEDIAKNLEKHYIEAVHKVKSGNITKGKVIAIKSDSVVVDVGYKSEGIIPISEFADEELSCLEQGDYIEVFIERINDSEGLVTLSRDKALKIMAQDALTTAYKNNSQIEGSVTGKTKGGLFVDVMGTKAFLPASQIDIKTVKDIDSYIGQIISVKILKMTLPKGYADISDNVIADNQIFDASVVVSRRAVIEEEMSRKKEETLKILKKDAILKGVVKNITHYGVFVDLGGIDGLLHISDISWRKANHPSEFFSEGDEGEFIVLKYDEETEKVALGYKQKKEDPWLSVSEKYNPGMRLKGKVVNIKDYGIFVEVEEGLEGLIHASEVDWSTRPKHPSKYVTVGNRVDVMVLGVNKDERRLSLGIKQLTPKPWELVNERYKVGQKVVGKIKTLTDFGAFVRLPEGVDGLIHISDILWIKHIKHPSEVLKKGDKVKAVVLSLEPNKERMALGIKQLMPDPWENEIPAKFKPGNELKGKILKITDFGVFVELQGGVEGLVYSSELNTSKEIKEGDDIWVRIIKVNVEERKIGLSMKAVTRGDE